MEGGVPEAKLQLKVTETLSKDVGRAFARMDPEDMGRLGVSTGDIVEVEGKRRTYCRVMMSYKPVRGQSRVQLDGITRGNAGVGLDATVVVRRHPCPAAHEVVIGPLDVRPSARDTRYIAGLLDGIPVIEGDSIRAALFGSRTAGFKVLRATPPGPVLSAARPSSSSGRRRAPRRNARRRPISSRTRTSAG